MRRALLLPLLLGLSLFLSGHTEQLVGNAASPATLSWQGTTTITIMRNAQTSALLPNIVGAGSDPVTAINNAFAKLGQASGLTFVTSGTTSVSEPANDTRNIVTFLDTPTNRSVVGGAIAVTVSTYQVSTGAISDADIVFNPAINHTTVGTAGAFDIESAALHEGGHLLGQDHSPLLSSIMFPFLPQAPASARVLGTDDEAGLATLYPATAGGSVSRVRGRILRSGNVPVFGAHVVLQHAISGAAITGGVSYTDGRFDIGAVPPGLYQLYAEPLDQPMTPASLSGGAWGSATMDTNFGTTFLGGGASSGTIFRVPVGGVRDVGDLTVASTAPSFDLEGFSLTTSSTGFSSYTGVGAEVTPPYNAFIAVGGPGLAGLPDSAFGVDSPFVTFGPNQTGSGTIPSLGHDFRIFPLVIANDAPPGGYSIRVTQNGATSILSGALRVIATTPPTAGATAYGQSGPGFLGNLRLDALGAPSLGNAAFGLRLFGTTAAGTGYFLLAGEPARFDLAVNAPVHLEPSTLLLPLPGIVFGTSNALTNIPTPIPNDPALAGLELYAQCLIVMPSGPFGLGFSNGVWLRLE